jgi:hypothetical protein
MYKNKINRKTYVLIIASASAAFDSARDIVDLVTTRVVVYLFGRAEEDSRVRPSRAISILSGIFG